MKKWMCFPRVFVGLIVLPLFGACEGEGPVVPRRSVYRETEFSWVGKGGSGTVTGQAMVSLNNGEVWKGDGVNVTLLPVNSYNQEVISRRYERGENLQNADPRAEHYDRDATADSSGSFSFHNVTPGEYWVGSRVTWNHWYWNDDGSKTTVYKPVYIYKRISVRNGQTVRVSSWIQGAEKTL